jgi:hypothetical protein
MTDTTTKAASLTPARISLIEDARKAGFIAEIDPNGYFRIYKEVCNGARPASRKGVCMYEDGTAFVIGVDLRVAKGMRSFKEIRSALGI